ncbi:unnamed protein product [Camellia sinensis]
MVTNIDKEVDLLPNFCQHAGKVLLSADWAGGITHIEQCFEGGPAEFRKVLSKYAIECGFQFRFRKNVSREEPKLRKKEREEELERLLRLLRRASRRPTVAVAPSPHRRSHHCTAEKKMASSSIDNTNLRLKQRFCTCGRIASMRIVRTNANGNKGRVYFVCPRKYDSNDHDNYFRWFADDDDDDITSSIRANADDDDITSRLGEHDRRLQRIENILKAVTYVIVFCVFLYFFM